MTARLLLVVGLQKSGTTLLSRLLEQTEAVTRAFPGEGNDFWGNEPVFAPEGYPAGTIYQRTGGASGHGADGGDATREMGIALRRRLDTAAPDAGLVLNKNPYNIVRLRWLRALFPDCLIVATSRQPAANVFSLTKKFVEHPGRGEPPRDGWWGVKPAGWASMVRPDKVEQCALQWQAVDEVLRRDRDVVDLVVEYERLCAEPHLWTQRVLDLAGATAGAPIADAPIRCRDDEFRTGSTLRSKNRLYRERGDLATPEDEPVELPPLTADQVERIESICGAGPIRRGVS